MIPDGVRSVLQQQLLQVAVLSPCAKANKDVVDNNTNKHHL